MNKDQNVEMLHRTRENLDLLRMQQVKSSGVILWAPQISVLNFMAILTVSSVNLMVAQQVRRTHPVGTTAQPMLFLL